MRQPLRLGLLFALSLGPVRLAGAADFTGTPAKMVRQHAIAVEESYSFLRTATDVSRLAASGGLVQVTGNADFTLSGVSFPFARPEVLSFVEHFAAMYHDSTGDQLVVTSLTRPETQQPRNAHVLSVHPAGMAVDLRVPVASAQRSWFDRTLEALQQAGAIDVTREHTPPHYHIAVFAEGWLPIAARADSAAAAHRARLPRIQPASVRAASLAPPAPASESFTGFVLSMVALAGLAVPALRTGARRAKRAG